MPCAVMINHVYILRVASSHEIHENLNSKLIIHMVYGYILFTL